MKAGEGRLAEGLDIGPVGDAWMRTAVSRAAKIFVGGLEGLLCRVCDSSEGGAKLRVEWRGWLPDMFELQDQFSGTKRQVAVVWRRSTDIDKRSTASLRPAGIFGRRRAVDRDLPFINRRASLSGRAMAFPFVPSDTQDAEPKAVAQQPDLSPEVGDGVNRKGGISWGCLTPPLLHRRSDMPCRTIASSS